jgi:threonine 3-dehydrogenase
MSKTMLALIKDKRAFGAKLDQIPIPQLGPKDVLIRVQASSICGTDLHIYEWDDWAERTVVTPNVFGHEFAGVVEAVGAEVNKVRIGDYVSAEGHFACGVCRSCRTGKAHVCRHTRSFGISAPGCFAEYALVPAHNVIPNELSLPPEIACLQDPLGNAVQAVLSGELVGKSVAVIGVGPIGLMALAVAKASGAGRIFAVDIHDYRLQMAQRMGADVVINSGGGAFAESLRSHTDGDGAEVVLEMSGHPGAIKEAFDAAAHGGRVSLLGIPSKEVSLNLANLIIFKGVHVDGITGRRMYDTWYQLKGLLDGKRIDLSPLVTHKFKLNQYEEAFALVKSGQCGKVVFIHEERNESNG